MREDPALPTRAQGVDPMEGRRQDIQQPREPFGGAFRQPSPQARHRQKHIRDDKTKGHMRQDLAVRPAGVEALSLEFLLG